MDAKQISLWLSALLGVSTAAAIALPDVRSSLSMSVQSTWVAFEDEGYTLPCPDGWKAVDPFTVDYPFHGFGWLPEAPPRGAHVAFLTRRDESSELFLIRGDAGELAGIEDRAATTMLAQPNVEPATARSVRMRDGSVVVLRIATVKPFAGREPFVCMLGGVEIGSERLLVNGGGPVKSFDLAGVVEILQQIEVPAPAAR